MAPLRFCLLVVVSGVLTLAACEDPAQTPTATPSSTPTLTATPPRGLSGAERYYSAGVELQDEGRLEEAIAEYDQAIRLVPNLGEAYGGRALALAAIGKDSEAKQDAERAVELGVDRALLEEAIEELKKQR